MTFDIENKDNQIVTSIYEKPSLKNYGTMKGLTLGAGGSGGDGISQSLIGTDVAADDFNGSNPVDVSPTGAGDIVHDGSTGGAQSGFD